MVTQSKSTVIIQPKHSASGWDTGGIGDAGPWPPIYPNLNSVLFSLVVARFTSSESTDTIQPKLSAMDTGGAGGTVLWLQF